MHVIETLRSYLNYEKIIMEENRKDVQSANRVMMNWLLCVGIFSYSILMITTFFEETYVKMRLAYGFILAVLILVLILHQFKDYFETLMLLYASYAVLVGVSIFTSSFVTEDTTSVWIVIMLLQIPIVILDRGWRINIAEILFTILYLFFIILFKNKNLVVDECINAIIAGVVGMVLGSHLRKTQLENFDLKRQAVIRETTDLLTGLNSRRKLFEYIAESRKGSGEGINGVVMMDIDNFKGFNDTYGHLDGDTCLRSVGGVLLEMEKKYPITFFRYGGEEFVGITSIQKAGEVFRICEETIAAISAVKFSHSGAPASSVTASVGLTVKAGQDNVNYEQMIHQADMALYEAKSGGKNRVMVYRP